MLSKGCLDLLIINNYYKELTLEQEKQYLPGQLCWAPLIYPSDPQQILELSTEYISPDEGKIDFIIKNFSWEIKTHIPIKSINLQQDEHLFVNKGKIRLTIILGNIITKWHKEQHIVLCIPVFSFKERHTQNYVIRTQAFAFRNSFYLPKDIYGCNEESAARFELCQPIFKKWLRPFRTGFDSMPIALSDEAHKLLIYHFIKFIFKKPWIEKLSKELGKELDDLDKEINAYKELLFEEYNIEDRENYFN